MNSTVTNYQSSSVVTDFLKPIGDNSKTKTAAIKFFTWLDGIIQEKSTEDQAKIYEAGTKYLRAIFDLKFNKQGGSSEEQIEELAKELNKLTTINDCTSVKNQGEAFAKAFAKAIDEDKLELLRQQGPIIAACLANTQDIKLMKLIDASINPEAFSGQGIELNEDSLKQLITGIQQLYQLSEQIGTDPRAAIQTKLAELGLSKDQASKLKEFMQEAIKQHQSGAAEDPTNAWIQNIRDMALSKEGVMAAGTVLYMFGGLLTQIPLIGGMLAPVVGGVQGLFQMMQSLLPMMLMIDRSKAAVVPSTKAEEHGQPKPAPAAASVA